MGVFDALNAKVVAAIDRRAGRWPVAAVSVDADRLTLTLADGSARGFAWEGLKRVVALRRDVYAGDQTTMLLEFADADAPVVEIAASVPGWSALAEAIDRLDGARRFGEWHAAALAAPVGEAVAVWPRAGLDAAPRTNDRR